MPYMDTIRAVHYNLNVPYISTEYVSFTPSSRSLYLMLDNFEKKSWENFLNDVPVISQSRVISHYPIVGEKF